MLIHTNLSYFSTMFYSYGTYLLMYIPESKTSDLQVRITCMNSQTYHTNQRHTFF